MTGASPSPFSTGVRLAIVAALCLALVAGVRALTADRIAGERARHAERMLRDVLGIGDFALAGAAERWRYTGAASGSLRAVVAPDGYNGSIRFWLAIDDDGTLRGVRVFSHRETPGLADDLEWPRSDWVESFRGIGPAATVRFDVRPHGGDFDAFTGATVTPRAVVRAIGRARAAALRPSEDAQLRPSEDARLRPSEDAQ